MKRLLVPVFSAALAVTASSAFSATVVDAYFNVDIDFVPSMTQPPPPICEFDTIVVDGDCRLQALNTLSEPAEVEIVVGELVPVRPISPNRDLIVDYEGKALTTTPDDEHDYSLGVYLYLDLDIESEPESGTPTYDFSTSIPLDPLNPFSVTDAVDLFTDLGGLGGDIAALYGLISGLADEEIGPNFGPGMISGSLAFKDISPLDYGPVVCGLLGEIQPREREVVLPTSDLSFGEREGICPIPPVLEAGIHLTLEREMAPIPLPAGLPLLLGALGGLGFMARRKHAK